MPETDIEITAETFNLGWDLDPTIHGVARLHRSVFERKYLEHQDHEEFRWNDDPANLLIGFTCCTGESWLAPLRFIRFTNTDVTNQIIQARGEHFRLQQVAPFFPNDTQSTVRNKQFEKANKKALQLLKKYLNRQQKRELKHLNAFRTYDREGREYWIEYKSHTNIKLVEENEELAKYCVVFTERNVPIYDLMLAQKFLLETNPEYFFDTAIRTPIITDSERIAQLPGRNSGLIFADIRQPDDVNGPEYAIINTDGIDRLDINTLTFNGQDTEITIENHIEGDLVIDDTVDPEQFEIRNTQINGQIHVPDGYELIQQEEDGDIVFRLRDIRQGEEIEAA